MLPKLLLYSYTAGTFWDCYLSASRCAEYCTTYSTRKLNSNYVNTSDRVVMVPRKGCHVGTARFAFYMIGRTLARKRWDENRPILPKSYDLGILLDYSSSSPN